MFNLILNRLSAYTNTCLKIICIYILIVPKVLNQLEYPFKLLKIQNLDNFSINHESITTDGSNQIKLLIQYYPYNKFDKFKLCE